MVKNPPASAVDAGDVSLIPGSGRSPGGGNDYLLQYSCLENSMDKGVWQATVHGASKSLTQHAYVYVCSILMLNIEYWCVDININ